MRFCAVARNAMPNVVHFTSAMTPAPAAIVISIVPMCCQSSPTDPMWTTCCENCIGGLACVALRHKKAAAPCKKPATASAPMTFARSPALRIRRKMPRYVSAPSTTPLPTAINIETPTGRWKERSIWK